MKTVFLTGVTGVLGGQILATLLQEESVRIVCLVRADCPTQATHRVMDVLRFHELGSRFLPQIETVTGDLESIDFSAIRLRITHIIHAASDLHLNLPADIARKMIFETTRRLIDYTNAVYKSTGSIEAFSYISTVGVGGEFKGPLPEKLLTEKRAFRNTYEASKAATEILVSNALDPSIRRYIFRPSMIVGDSHTGKISRFQVFYTICELLSGRPTHGLLPNWEKVCLDTISVDYVARAVVLGTLSGEKSRCFNICSGSAALTLCHIETIIERLYSDHPTFNKKHLPVLAFRLAAALAIPFLNKTQKQIARGIPYYLRYLQTLQPFKNDETTAFFRSCGLALPAPEQSIEISLQYYRASGKAGKLNL